MLGEYFKMSRKELDKKYSFHHSALTRGYVSRKGIDQEEVYVQEYSGRFGEGVVYDAPNWESNRYCYRNYYIKK